VTVDSRYQMAQSPKLIPSSLLLLFQPWFTWSADMMFLSQLWYMALRHLKNLFVSWLNIWQLKSPSCWGYERVELCLQSPIRMVSTLMTLPLHLLN